MRALKDDIGAVVARMRQAEDGPPYYLYGKRRYINGILGIMGKNSVQKYTKFPLIALRFDNDEDVADSFQYDLNIVIAVSTKIQYRIEERYSRNITPALYPLYESFLRELRNSGLFQWPYEGTNNGFPPHTKVDRPYWGSGGLEENEENVFTDVLDAIEIKNLKINSINKLC